MSRPCDKPGHTARRTDGRCVLCIKAAQQRHYRANIPGYKQRALDWNKNNPERRQAISRRYHYGVQADSVRPCPELCELCGIRKATEFDHDHVTGKFRGWLCTRCNTALAAFGDGLAGLFRAIGYICNA